MNKKIKNILKIIIILFVLLIISNIKVYASDMNQRIEMFYEKFETEDGIFYKYKKFDQTKSVITYSTSLFTDEDQKVIKIIKETIDEYMKKFTDENCPLEQKIENDYYQSVVNIYSTSKEKTYNDGDDISTLVAVYAKPVDGNSNYWKKNFSNNELSYNQYDEKYHVTIYYFVKLSFNEENGKYEITYIDLKPENLEEEITKLKEEKGLDLKNLNVKDLMNISYDDQIKAIPSSESTAVSAEKTEYNAEQIEEISNTAQIIRIACISSIIIVVLLGIIKVWREK